jgi:hypothetical protein
MKFTNEQKLEYREAKKNKIIALRKILSQMSDDQRQALAEKFGIVTVEGHQLSIYNQCFLVTQTPINFTVVGGFRQWLKAGRTVKKGEHGFLILVPSKKENEENSEIDNFILDDENVRFYTATVFDVSQTQIIE